jgi:hypothetical protein
MRKGKVNDRWKGKKVETETWPGVSAGQVAGVDLDDRCIAISIGCRCATDIVVLRPVCSRRIRSFIMEHDICSCNLSITPTRPPPHIAVNRHK